MRDRSSENSEYLSREVDREGLANSIYEQALAEHPEFEKILEEEMRALIKTALSEIERLERLADRKQVLETLTPEVADKISAIWVPSGPGTYPERRISGRKVDESHQWLHQIYQKNPWMIGMDRERVGYAAFLIRKIAELKDEEGIGKKDKGRIKQSIPETRELIEQNGPGFVYQGADEQNTVMIEASKDPDIILPDSKIHIMGEGLVNTVDQVKDFSLPEELHESGNEIAIVSHAPHLMRTMHILNRYRTLPKDMEVRLFPIATPPEQKDKYASMEIRGLLYYAFLSENRDATEKPYPYIIQGE